MTSAPGTHERVVADAEIKGSSNRAFGLVFATVFAVVGLMPLLRRGPVRWWCVAAAATLLLVAMAWPAWLGPFNRLWQKVGLLLHRVTTPVVMGFVFYSTVTPIGLLLRAFGKDLLNLRLDRSAKTYWIERRPPGPLPDTMRRQF
jgi:hypothetical protein